MGILRIFFLILVTFSIFLILLVLFTILRWRPR